MNQGLRNLLRELGARPGGPNCVIVTDLREELVAYVRGVPYLRRELEMPAAALHHAGLNLSTDNQSSCATWLFSMGVDSLNCFSSYYANRDGHMKDLSKNHSKVTPSVFGLGREAMYLRGHYWDRYTCSKIRGAGEAASGGLDERSHPMGWSCPPAQ
jgi:hypothetical protein